MDDKKLREVLDEMNEFSVPTYAEWKDVTEQSLKGASFERLLTKTYEGITLQPMYQRHMLEDDAYQKALPAVSPFRRGTEAATSWIVNQEIAYEDPKQANEALCHDLDRGQTGIHLVLKREEKETGVYLQDKADFRTVFENINLERFPVHIDAGPISLPVIASFVAYLKAEKVFLGNIRGCLGADPLGTLVKKGSLPYSIEVAYDILAHVTDWSQHHMPKLATILVHSHPYHDGGGSAVEELAFALATGVEYVDNMLKRGLSIDDIAPRLTFSLSIGSNLFMEIAKFRAARVLWATIVKAFGGNHTSQKMNVHARTSTWNKTIFDPHVNILRGAMEAFAGAIGGVDSMHIAPFDELTKTPSEFSRRIARNTQIILQEEAHLGKVMDPAGGSSYVEALTDEIARKTWELFQQVEEKGGMLAALQAGFPQRKITETAKKRDEQIKRRKDVFVGTNKYANPLEKIDMQKEKKQHIKEKRSGQSVGSLERTSKTLLDDAMNMVEQGVTIAHLLETLTDGLEEITIERIEQKRGAEPFEQLRLAMERYAIETGERLQVFLANVGPIGGYKARSDFASGFFEVGGFKVITNNGYETVEKVVQAAQASEADTIVICGKDDIYPNAVLPILEKLANEKTTVYLAGQPPEEDVARYKEAGLEEVIHLGTNVYDVLYHLQKKKGVVSEQ